MSGQRPIAEDRWSVKQWPDTKRPSVVGLDGAVASVTSGRQDHAHLIKAAPSMRAALDPVGLQIASLMLMVERGEAPRADAWQVLNESLEAIRAALREADGAQS